MVTSRAATIPFFVAWALILGAACGSSSSGSSSPSEPNGGNDGGADVATDVPTNPSDGAAGDGGIESLLAEDQSTIALGALSTCAILEAGSVKCWGGNPHGALGLEDAVDRGDGPGEMGAALPVVALGRPAVAIAAGGWSACAILDDGSVKCWGYNGYGQLGLGDIADRGAAVGTMGAALATVDLGPGRTALGIAVGAQHACARLNDGHVKCWGRNFHGELGLGDKISRGDGPGEMGAALVAVDLGPGRTARAIVANGFRTCARLDDGSVKCWGDGEFGVLGTGDENDRGDSIGEMGSALLPIDLGPGRKVLGVSMGSRHVCAILDDVTVKCWGWNDSGELGLNDVMTRGDGPFEMGAALPVVDLGPGRIPVTITAGSDYNCVRFADGALKCWGNNDFGQLGLGDQGRRGTGPGNQMGAVLPIVDLGVGAIVVEVAASGSTCARLSAGAIKCWGFNKNGQLGLGDNNHRGDEPGEMGAALPAVVWK